MVLVVIDKEPTVLEYHGTRVLEYRYLASVSKFTVPARCFTLVTGAEGSQLQVRTDPELMIRSRV